MFTPLAVTRGLVVNSRQESEVFEGDLLLLDAQLVVELALRRVLDALDGFDERRARLAGDVERVRAAGVRPHVGERDLLRGALLEEQSVLVVEQEDGEGAVKQALVDVGHQVAYCEAKEKASVGILWAAHLLAGAAIDKTTCYYVQSFLLAVPIGRSFSSRTMHTSSIKRICSSSWPSSAAEVVSMSGNRRRMFSAVMGAVSVVVVVVVVDILTRC